MRGVHRKGRKRHRDTGSLSLSFLSGLRTHLNSHTSRGGSRHRGQDEGRRHRPDAAPKALRTTRHSLTAIGPVRPTRQYSHFWLAGFSGSPRGANEERRCFPVPRWQRSVQFLEKGAGGSEPWGRGSGLPAGTGRGAGDEVTAAMANDGGRKQFWKRSGTKVPGRWEGRREGRGSLGPVPPSQPRSAGPVAGRQCPGPSAVRSWCPELVPGRRPPYVASGRPAPHVRLVQGGDRAVTALSCPGSCKAFRSLRRSSVVSSVPDVCQGVRFCFCDRRSLVVSYVLVTACVEKQAVSKRGSCVSWICLSKHPEKGSMWETKEL